MKELKTMLVAATPADCAVMIDREFAGQFHEMGRTYPANRAGDGVWARGATYPEDLLGLALTLENWAVLGVMREGAGSRVTLQYRPGLEYDARRIWESLAAALLARGWLAGSAATGAPETPAAGAPDPGAGDVTGSPGGRAEEQVIIPSPPERRIKTDRAIELRRAGVTIEGIAEEVEMSVSQVKRWLDAAGLVKKKNHK